MKVQYIILVCASYVASRGGGGGGGRSSGGTDGGRAGGTGFLAGKAADSEAVPFPPFLKWVALAIGILCIFACFGMYFLERLIVLFRKKKDVE